MALDLDHAEFGSLRSWPTQFAQRMNACEALLCKGSNVVVPACAVRQNILNFGDGRYRVVNLKTSASSLAQDRLEFDHQATAYLMAAERILAATGNVDFEFWVLTKAKQPAFRIYPVQRSAAQRAKLIEVVRDVRAAEAAGIFPRQCS